MSWELHEQEILLDLLISLDPSIGMIKSVNQSLIMFNRRLNCLMGGIFLNVAANSKESGNVVSIKKFECEISIPKRGKNYIGAIERLNLLPNLIASGKEYSTCKDGNLYYHCCKISPDAIFVFCSKSRVSNNFLLNLKPYTARLNFIIFAMREHQQNDLLRGVIDGNPEIMVVVDGESGLIVDANNTAIETLKSTKIDLEKTKFSKIEKRFSRIYSKHWERVVQYLGENNGKKVNLKLLDTEGSLIPVRATVNIVSIKQNRYIQIYAVDITDEQNLRQALKESNQIADHVTQLASLGEMLAVIAHDIRNPLSVISQSAEMVLQNFEKTQDVNFVIKRLRAIKRASTLINSIVRSTLNVAYKQVNDSKVIQPIIDIVKDIGDFYSTELRGRGIDLKIAESKHKFMVLCHPTQISQVLMNLIANSKHALLHTRKGQINIEVKKVGNQCHIIFQDNGPGIPKEIREKIFNPYFTTKPKGEGTGIGLDNCAKIMREHGGEIKLFEGTTEAKFLLVLPIAQSKSQDVA